MTRQPLGPVRIGVSEQIFDQVTWYDPVRDYWVMPVDSIEHTWSRGLRDPLRGRFDVL